MGKRRPSKSILDSRPAPVHSQSAKVDFLPPLKPRPRLLLALGILLAVWIAFLIATYFFSR